MNRFPRVLNPRNLLSAVCLAIGLAAAAAIVPALPMGAGAPVKKRWMADFSPPASGSFFITAGEPELSQSVLFHDLGPSIDNARKADVLFLGNSRMPTGLRGEFLVPRAEGLGLRLFSFGCGHSELLRFPLELIRKHDLRPSVVVANGGPHMFEEGMSTVAEHAMEISRFAAVKNWAEVTGAWNLRSRLHRYVPRLDVFDLPLHTDWILYRSARTGWWQPLLEPDGRYPIESISSQENWSRLLPLAQELDREVRDRGGILVLTIVPYGDTEVGHLPFLADALGAPLIVPDFRGATLGDGSHLNRDSARRVSREFWERFVQLPEVRAALDL